MAARRLQLTLRDLKIGRGPLREARPILPCNLELDYFLQTFPKEQFDPNSVHKAELALQMAASKDKSKMRARKSSVNYYLSRFIASRK